jgi:hypothetical protein
MLEADLRRSQRRERWIEPGSEFALDQDRQTIAPAAQVAARPSGEPVDVLAYLLGNRAADLGRQGGKTLWFHVAGDLAHRRRPDPGALEGLQRHAEQPPRPFAVVGL